jgi:hypothetical protein
MAFVCFYHKLVKIIFILFPILAIAQQSYSIRDHLVKTHETAGVCFQMQTITPEEGNEKTYHILSIPLQMRYELSRYLSFILRLNQGYHSYGGTSLYTLGDMEISARYLSGENLTLVGGITLPTGTKELNYDQLSTTSAGRLPFINAPVIYGASGFGLHGGISYGKQATEKRSFAFGALYRKRGEYTYVDGGGKYDPADEFMLAGGLEYKDGDEQGYMANIQIISYSVEKMNGEEIGDPGTGFAFNGSFYLRQLQLIVLYYYRGESQRENAGDFLPPSIFNGKLGYRKTRPFIPYVGLTYTGKGTLVDSAVLLLGGFCFEDFKIGGYPWNPFIEVNYGMVGEATKTFGLKVGTDVSFQIY